MKKITKRILLFAPCFLVLLHSSCKGQQAEDSNLKATNHKENQAIAFQKVKDDFCECISDAMLERNLDVKGSLVACNSYFFKSTNKSFQALEREILKSIPDSSTIQIDHTIYDQVILASFETCVKQAGFNITDKKGALNFLRKMKEKPPIELPEDQISNIQYEHSYEIFQKIKKGYIDSIANDFVFVKDFNKNRETLVQIHSLIKDIRGVYTYAVDSTQKPKVIYITQAHDTQTNKPVCELRFEYQHQDMFPKVNKITMIPKEKMVVKSKGLPPPPPMPPK